MAWLSELLLPGNLLLPYNFELINQWFKLLWGGNQKCWSFLKFCENWLVKGERAVMPPLKGTTPRLTPYPPDQRLGGGRCDGDQHHQTWPTTVMIEDVLEMPTLALSLLSSYKQKLRICLETRQCYTEERHKCPMTYSDSAHSSDLTNLLVAMLVKVKSSHRRVESPFC